MATDGKPSGMAIHATAVAIAGRAFLILGSSRSGKSSLAVALINRSTSRVPILLIGDDRILFQPVGACMMARVHPRVAGFIERRGLGLVASPFIDQAPIHGIICLDSIMPHPDLVNFPMLRVVFDRVDEGMLDQLLSWAVDHDDAAGRTQGVAKRDRCATSIPKD